MPEIVAIMTDAAAGNETTYWLHADDRHLWASVGTYTHREVLRFDFELLVPTFRTPESDLNVFEFDYDLTWMGFFLDGAGRELGRYGGRDALSAEGRSSPRRRCR